MIWAILFVGVCIMGKWVVQKPYSFDHWTTHMMYYGTIFVVTFGTWISLILAILSQLGVIA